MESFTEAWNLICDFCKNRITEVAFTTWISRIEPVTLDFNQGTAILKVPNDFHRQTLERCYTPLLTEALDEVFGPGLKVKFVVPEELGQQKEERFQSDTDYDYTFDTFIVGPSNKFAHAASIAVATKPATLYNPLFIYGNSGLGKTHLLYAICNEISFRHPADEHSLHQGRRVHERNDRGDPPRHHAGVPPAGTARPTFSSWTTFSSSPARNRPRRNSSTRSTRSMNRSARSCSRRTARPRISPRSRNVCSPASSGALTADIQPPDFETRLAIIRRKAELLDITIPENVCEYIAQPSQEQHSPARGRREENEGLPPSERTGSQHCHGAGRHQRHHQQRSAHAVTVEKIIEEVARTFGITSDEIRSAKRSANISKARQMAMYVVREITQLPTEAIGSEFGGRDHSTVVYALQQMEKNIQKDSKIKATAEDIIKNIRDSAEPF